MKTLVQDRNPIPPNFCRIFKETMEIIGKGWWGDIVRHGQSGFKITN
jgi:hypothetical protein